MITKLIFISVLILAILVVTWVKDRENMNPPLRRRIVIDLTTIAIFWLLFIGFVLIGEGRYDENIGSIIDLSLMFFTARLVQLVAVMNPMVQELVAFIKNRGNSETKD
ncbi:holin [Lactococcus lactis]|uniref:holin n=1 Tax=Lactococcus lactis TaxID=1358 RepID=UPI001BAC39CC|nr:holin [Lactococcus lactis]MBR8679344.1 holin [Lactococcus lactis subsp. lactis]MBR8681704.1 holin [Lactococcus lactis subsp. lactis]MBR8686828.1 holin [Lactococcus lactis subsp. lactis]